jgi:ferredoxin-NADP reductase
MSAGAEKIAVTVTDIVKLNDLVTRFKFEPTAGGLLPTFSGGAHTVIEMKDGEITRLNPYSLMSDPADQTAYTISVRRDDEGRGGSLFMHNNVSVGDHMVIINPVN